MLSCEDTERIQRHGGLGVTSLSDGFQDGYALEFRATTYRLPSGAALVSG